MSDLRERQARERRAAHAGSFYPADPVALAALVDRLASPGHPEHPERSDRPDRALAPVGVLVPHAGLQFSGAVAAAGWRFLAADPPTTVIVAGTNHFAGWLDGIGVWTGGAWATPLGPIEIDGELAEAIAGLGEPFRSELDAHLGEHSIEVQTPFLARLLPGVRIVPLLVSPGADRCAVAGSRLGRWLADAAPLARVALVASSDFAHYPPARTAELVTDRLLGSILGLDPERLVTEERTLRVAGLPGLVCGLCGLEPVTFALAAWQAMGGREVRLLAAATSADVPEGDARRTVGYAAVACVP